MNRLFRLFSRRRLEADLEKELSYHFDRRVAELIRQGLDAQEAKRQARLEFGGSDEIKEACRDVRGTRWFDDLIQDFRYGMRLLRRSPAFTAVAIVSLA